MGLTLGKHQLGGGGAAGSGLARADPTGRTGLWEPLGGGREDVPGGWEGVCIPDNMVKTPDCLSVRFERRWV